jgi:hypothetical protein
MATRNINQYGGNVVNTLAATGNSDPYLPEPGGFNYDISGTWTGSWKFQRSFDAGTTWADYTFADQTFNPTSNASSELAQIEKGTLWRISFTKASGSLVVRLSQ